jgi:hypothetical protein
VAPRDELLLFARARQTENNAANLIQTDTPRPSGYLLEKNATAFTERASE